MRYQDLDLYGVFARPVAKHPVSVLLRVGSERFPFPPAASQSHGQNLHAGGFAKGWWAGPGAWVWCGVRLSRFGHSHVSYATAKRRILKEYRLKRQVGGKGTAKGLLLRNGLRWALVMGGEEAAKDQDVRAAITAAQAERIEFFRGLGLIPGQRNTFVKFAVEEKLRDLAKHALEMEDVQRLAAEQEEAADAASKSWRRSGS